MPSSVPIPGVNDLASQHPLIAAEADGWDPKNVCYGSTKKMLWRCPMGHQYEKQIDLRALKGYGCPYCSGKQVLAGFNDLKTIYPEIAEEVFEWDPTTLTAGSAKERLWKCPKGHPPFPQMVKTKVKLGLGKGCPYCRGLKVVPEESLSALFPDIAAQWHPTKNGKLTPEQTTVGSNKKIWWQCQKFEEHVWQSVVHSRTRSGAAACPECGETNQSSRPEMRVLAELRQVLESVVSRKIIKSKGRRFEIDIYIPELKIGIEYDGFYYHKDKDAKDANKNQWAKEEGITLVRLRENPLKKIVDHDVLVGRDNLRKRDINCLLESIRVCAASLPEGLEKNLNKYLSKSRFVADDLYQSYIKNFPAPLPENSLASLHPDIASEWHTEKNYPLEPLDFSPFSKQHAWWQCPVIEDHVYSAVIGERTGNSKTNCPYCAGKKASSENSLLSLFPDISAEWHPTKNGRLSPGDVVAGSHKNVWWQCKKDPTHEWNSEVQGRTSKNGGWGHCPHCKTLAVKSPEIAAQWHPTKNGSLTPEQVPNRGDMKVWWQCPKVKEHVYEARVADRSDKKRARGCPFCSGNKVSPERSLSTLSPSVAKEWHPTKNAPLTPDDLTNSSNKKFWWQCKKDPAHEWEAQIYARTKAKGTGCPHCYRSKSKK